ncbi:hypothetical protein UFOVP1596_1 [uncultured Caudovirales phage]|uniref:Uncharacterized protein n=1 Tax=uncultured Caudovirales phage TaxID=2100421 RepID=A0A6J5SRJ7_9CAUD|nr:hypothetical protein UFOVP1596_1 [uncultured Caudovirales phage]
MAKITNINEAINHVNRHGINILTSADTLVVSSTGGIHINCVVDATCNDIESKKLEAYVLKGERTVKAKKKSEPSAQ